MKVRLHFEPIEIDLPDELVTELTDDEVVDFVNENWATYSETELPCTSITRLAGLVAAPPERKHYVIAHDEYMGSGYDIYEFVGTWHELLIKLVGHESVVDENPDTGDNRDIFLSDEQLEEEFNEFNGDGGPYYTVWSVEDRKKVLG